MKKSINLNSSEWCDIVFEGRNKAYGAYAMRQSASKRYMLAFMLTLSLMIFVTFLPSLLGMVKAIAKTDRTIMDGDRVLSEIPVDVPIKEDLLNKPVAPPPPPTKTTIKFTPPVIVEGDVDEKEMMKTHEELDKGKYAISVEDRTGTDEVHGVIPERPIIHDIIVEKPKDQGPVFVAQQMPMYLGGESEMYKFIGSNLKYPVVPMELGLQGKVTVRFVVTKTGTISDVTVLRGFDPACDNEAKRVVKLMPNWIPGKQNGVNVAVYYTIPIVFKLKQ